MKIDKFPAYCRLEIGGEYVDLAFPTKLQMTGASKVFGSDGTYEYLREATKHKKIEHVIDVGANAGYMSIVFNTAFPDSDILALEPVELNYKYLLHNTQAFPRITPLKVGAYKKRALVVIGLPTDEQRQMDYHMAVGNPGLYSLFGKDESFNEVIQVDTLDNIATKRVDYLKLDIEGAELDALQGATRILTEDRPVLQVELRSQNIEMAGRTAKQYQDFFEQYNYSPVGRFFGDGILMPSEVSMEVWTLPWFM